MVNFVDVKPIGIDDKKNTHGAMKHLVGKCSCQVLFQALFTSCTSVFNLTC